LYWHDAIYDPTASDNEARSANLLRNDAAGILPEEEIEAAAQIIRATEKHCIPDGVDPALRSDMGLFLDLDLSILGQPRKIFDAYEAAIKKEYGFVPMEAYRKGRSAVLKSFLGRPQLYFTNEIRLLWENTARENLARSIDALG
jgi:predicted metal-dependent HD superfamily phosphohydrolase